MSYGRKFSMLHGFFIRDTFSDEGTFHTSNNVLTHKARIHTLSMTTIVVAPKTGVINQRPADVFCAARVHVCNVISLCIMKNSYLISGKKLFSILGSNYRFKQPFSLMKNIKSRTEMTDNTWRDASESQQKLNIILNVYSNRRSVKFSR
jgi:hypothetical protein